MVSFLFKAAFWLLCTLIAVLSLLTTDQLPPQTLHIWDKAQHAVGFMLLSAAGLAAYPRRYRSLGWGLLAFGAAIELAQSFTTWRQGDGWDWIADAVGIALVMLLAQRFAHNPAARE
ncbi:VanZ family protein [Hydrogenophaga sp. PAMC20947]|uniref:VanZ family protein n=1 Tax=Hydrogenophaga sp. PAMC20947 TaxID=2565558 RepID=UPI00109D8906|nr:VanZ family protein [Hydrogenophaga sp. PAMC20947]QCB45373.1 VanZ family protein [Hydrogenophaga sp. PAMC20947]